MRARHPLVIAHRGASGYRPEHTADVYPVTVSLGADAIEPDLVATADGVLVIRHENELSGTTDVAQHTDFAGRRATKEGDGRLLTGWFTEDFTWQELSALRARERVLDLRPENTQFDDHCPILRLADFLRLTAAAMDEAGRPLQVVAEVKSPTYFRSIGLPTAEFLEHELALAGFTPSTDWLTLECFEKTFLEDVASRGVAARRVYLTESSGAAYDLVARDGADALTYAEELTARGLASLAGRTSRTGGPSSTLQPLLDGVSVHKSLLADEYRGRRAAHADRPRCRSRGPVLHAPPREPIPVRAQPAPHPGADGPMARGVRQHHGHRVDGVFADHFDLACRAREERRAGTDPTDCPPSG